MKEILAGFALTLLAIIELVQSAFIYAGCSTLIGIIIFICCIAAFGPLGLISLIFILPFISKGIIEGKLRENRKDNLDNDTSF